MDEGSNEKANIKKFQKDTKVSSMEALRYMLICGWDYDTAMRAYKYDEKSNDSDNNDNEESYNSRDNASETDTTNYGQENGSTNMISYVKTLYNFTIGWLFWSFCRSFYGIYNFLSTAIWTTDEKIETHPKVCEPNSIFIRYFEVNYGLQHVNFSKYSLKDAIYKASYKKKPIIIFLHDVLSSNSTYFCKNYFSNPKAIELLDSLFEIWAVECTSKDAVQAMIKFSINVAFPTVVYSKEDNDYAHSFSFFYLRPYTVFLQRCANLKIISREYTSSSSSSNSVPSRINYTQLATTTIIKKQNEDYEQLLLQEQLKKNKIKEEEQRLQQKLDSIQLKKKEFLMRVKKSQEDFEDRPTTFIDEIDPSQVVNFRIYYPDRKSSQVCCLKSDPIKRVVDHIFISNPNIEKKFSLSLPLKKREFFRYGDNENIACEKCSLDSSYRITLAYLSSDDESSDCQDIDNTADETLGV